MREIKFRGLDKNGNWRFGYYHAVHGAIQTYHYIRESSSDKRIDPVTLGQFTGFNDANGKDIYEGDVVRTYMGNICEIRWDFVSEKTSKLDFEYTGFCFHHLKLRQNFHLDVTSSCEVIGNIYEHKELID